MENVSATAPVCMGTTVQAPVVTLALVSMIPATVPAMAKIILVTGENTVRIRDVQESVNHVLNMATVMTTCFSVNVTLVILGTIVEN